MKHRASVLAVCLVCLSVRLACAVSLSTSVIVTVIPNAPSNLTAVATAQTQVSLTWTDNSNNEDYFSVERKTGAGGTYAELATTTANVGAFLDNSVMAATTYFYRIAAINADGSSFYSNEASTTTPSAPLPPPPSNSGGGGGGGGGLGRGKHRPPAWHTNPHSQAHQLSKTPGLVSYAKARSAKGAERESKKDLRKHW